MTRTVYQVEYQDHESHKTLGIVSSIAEAVDLVYYSLEDTELLIELPRDFQADTLYYKSNFDTIYSITRYGVWFPA